MRLSHTSVRTPHLIDEPERKFMALGFYLENVGFRKMVWYLALNDDAIVRNLSLPLLTTDSPEANQIPTSPPLRFGWGPAYHVSEAQLTIFFLRHLE